MGNNLVYVDPGKNNQIHCQAPNDEVILKAFVEPSPTPTPSTTPVRLAFDVDPSQNYDTTNAACVGTPTWYDTAYLEMGYSVPTVGAYFYTTSGGSTGYAPGACVGPKYHLVRNGGNIWAVQVGNNTPVDGCDNTGEILAVGDCSSLPTPTPTPTTSVTPTPTLTPTPSITPPGQAYAVDNQLSLTACVVCYYTGTDNTVYLPPQYADPIAAIGDYVYTTSALTTEYSQIGQWQHFQRQSDGIWFSVEVDYSGEILDAIACSTCPSPTPTPTLPAASPTPTPTPSITPTCARPGTVESHNLIQAMQSKTNLTGYTSFTGSKDEACWAADQFTTNNADWWFQFSVGQSVDLEYGTYMYHGTGTNCTLKDDGWYFLTTGYTSEVIHIENGVIADYPVDCTFPTPTPTPTISVTPTIPATPTPTPTPTASAVAPLADAVACWNLGEASGTLSDSIGSSDLTTTTNITYGETGKSGDCILIPRNGYAYGTADSSLQDVKDSMSVSFWVKRDASELDTHPRYVFTTRQDLGGTGGSFAQFGENLDEFSFYFPISNTLYGTTLSYDFTGTGWFHIVVTLNHNTNALKIYVNGTLETSPTVTQDPYYMFAPYRVILGNIAEDQFWPYYGLGGYLDSFTIWDRDLTSSEVSYMYNGGSGQACS